MQKIIFIFSFLLIANFSFAQINLVPNPSFEDTLGCPQGYPDLDTKCQDWKSFRITPDYFNNCSSVCGYYNQAGYQQPNSGNAYAGFCTYQVTNSTAREHIGVQLVSPLLIGTKYYVSFFVSPAWSNLLTNIATNKTGMLLTTFQYSDPNGDNPLPNSCTVYSDSIIKDTLSWYKIQGSFIADSSYQYLIIGNFFDDSLVDTINFPYQVVPQVAYYYLDDVCVSTDSIYAQTWTGFAENIHSQIKIKIYPNPATDVVNIISLENITKVQLLNTLGEIIYSFNNNGSSYYSLSLINVPSGLYFIKVYCQTHSSITTINLIH